MAVGSAVGVDVGIGDTVGVGCGVETGLVVEVGFSVFAGSSSGRCVGSGRFVAEGFCVTSGFSALLGRVFCSWFDCEFSLEALPAFCVSVWISDSDCFGAFVGFALGEAFGFLVILGVGLAVGVAFADGSTDAEAKDDGEDDISEAFEHPATPIPKTQAKSRAIAFFIAFSPIVSFL